MKYQVKIGSQTFDVEIADLHSQPAIVIVNGETIEVWKETSPGTSVKADKPRLGAQLPENKAAVPPKLTRPEVDNETKGDSLSVSAPIPGVIVAVTVHEGDNVEPGDELCVLEAMKMKNTIRSPRAGKIGRVLIHLNQTVKHRDTLLEFSE